MGCFIPTFKARTLKIYPQSDIRTGPLWCPLQHWQLWLFQELCCIFHNLCNDKILLCVCPMIAVNGQFQGAFSLGWAPHRWTPQHRWRHREVRHPAVWKLDKFVHFLHTWTPCALAPWLKAGTGLRNRYVLRLLVPNLVFTLKLEKQQAVGLPKTIRPVSSIWDKSGCQTELAMGRSL